MSSRALYVWIGVALAGLIVLAAIVGDDDPEPAAVTTTVTVTTPPPSPPPPPPSEPVEPTETIADAQKAIVANEYAEALDIAKRIDIEDTVRQRIANQLGRRASAAVKRGDRRAASSLLRQAGDYPGTQATTQAQASLRAAQGRASARRTAARAAAERARQARAAAEQTAAEPSASNCDPNYSGCVPPYPPDVNCADVSGPVQVLGSDPHGLDRDGDGIGCE
ncbi:MAG: excalibur calcium-binding domain-containing protein [Solirubrobacteraceae bacterium]|nr:excalibur calcium-binding domain-containing protein [Solirubrobacteraceae bacterium]